MTEPPSQAPELTDVERDELLARIDEISTNLRRIVEESRREREAFRASMETFRTDLIDHLRANSRRILRELLLKYFPDYSEEEIDEAFRPRGRAAGPAAHRGRTRSGRSAAEACQA